MKLFEEAYKKKAEQSQASSGDDQKGSEAQDAEFKETDEKK